MFKNLLNRLNGTASDEPLSTDDARLAMAALLVRVARADHDYAPAEIAVINALLMQRYNLDAAGADALRNEAEALEANAPDTVRFTRLIKEAVPYEERNAVAESLWRVVMADDERHHYEDSLLRLVVKLIGVSDQDSGLARQRAQAD
ncbi:MAG: TerB family tellurite resistance protein [Paracoccaceae bacterium]